MEEKYVPAIPSFIAEIIEKEKRFPMWKIRRDMMNREDRQKFDKWVESYSRKYKYAKLNGYTINNEPTDYCKKYKTWHKFHDETPVETLEQAYNKKTTTGKCYCDLSIKQLRFVIEHTTSEANKVAARLVIANHKYGGKSSYLSSARAISECDWGIADNPDGEPSDYGDN